MTTFLKAFFLCWLACINVAWAAEPVLISTSIPFAKAKSIGILDAADCAWNAKLVSEIVRQSKGRVAIANGELVGSSGQYLKMEVVDVYAPPGSRFSGDKWISIRGDLFEGGKRIAGFDFSETGNGFTACSALEGVAKDLASDVSDWLKKPLPECAPSCFERPQAEIIKIAAEIPYASPEAATAEVRRECDWNRLAVDTLVQLSNGALEVASGDLSSATGKKLVINAIEVHTAGGSTLGGPKWITVRGELFDQNKLVGSFRSQQRTISGTFEGCATLRSLGRHLAVEVSEWLDDPRMDSKL